MTVPTIPNPNNAKFMAVKDSQGAAEYDMVVTIGPNNTVDFGDRATIASLTAAQLAVIASNGLQQGGETLLASNALVDLNTATASTIYTVPTGKSAVITRIVLRLASTSLTTVSISIGFNSASFNDIIANAAHTELTGNTLFTSLLAKIGAKIGTSAQALKLLCNTLQGGAATCTVEVFGYLF